MNHMAAQVTHRDCVHRLHGLRFMSSSSRASHRTSSPSFSRPTTAAIAVDRPLIWSDSFPSLPEDLKSTAITDFLAMNEPGDYRELWRQAARACVQLKLGAHLGWLSRHPAWVGEEPRRVEHQAELDLSNHREFSLSVSDLEFLVDWVGKRSMEDQRPLKIDLSCNAIGPQRLERVCALLGDASVVSLDVSNCKLNGTRVAHLCGKLESNLSLRELNLHGNSCSGAGHAIGTMLARNRALVSLDLTRCKLGPDSITEVAKGLGGNSSLEHLDLGHNDRTQVDKGIIQLALSLQSRQTSLRRLGLSGLRLTRPDECVSAIASMMCKNPRIESLHLAGWHLSTKGMSALGELLATTKTLRQLDLSVSEARNNQSGLYEGLSKNSSLITLELEGWRLDDGLAEALEQVLLSGTCRLETLSIVWPGWVPTLSDSIFEPLARAMEKNRTLVHFHCALATGDQEKFLIEIKRRVEENRCFLQALPGLMGAAMTKLCSRPESTEESLPPEMFALMTEWISLIGGNLAMRNIVDSVNQEARAQR
jgi:hypothetical protein